MQKISKLLLICVIFMVSSSIFMAGCYNINFVSLNGNNDNDNNNNGKNILKNEPKDYERPEGKNLPEEIQDWVNRSLNINLGQSKIYGDRQYILVTYGEKPTGGYYVNIEDVKILEDKVEVDVRFKAPQEGDMVTQAITYAYDLVVIKAVDLPVKYNVLGDEMHLMTLKGIDQLKPFAAESSQIKIFEPAPNKVVEKEFVISGIASVFEGNIVYEILDEEDNSLYENYTTAGMGDWYYFELKIEIPEEISNKFKVELYSPSAIDRSKTNVVTIPLRLTEK